ncbi:hypothetical protein [Paraburkholderia sp. SOS3]|jgi:hypothetical protein|uniref:hypothetical protein n=1 Tax=Paraburkholderia sp. SOS3 TaxID=1926494 RepID=UPI00094743EF|nr:hypothetical protein [Paraburkholderia sp. SOS3]APR38117.1 hypothetical protein BTO02_21560 [Paraburkholderia sp. SOS3]
MKDAFERRALLLHLGAVLDAMDKVLSHSADHATITLREFLSAHSTLAKLPLLQHVAGEMTAHEFVRLVSTAFAVWPAELLETALNRERLAAVVRDTLFAANDDGWRAYAASLKDEVSWFGDQLPPLPRAATEATAGLYPSWPWKPQN